MYIGAAAARGERGVEHARTRTRTLTRARTQPQHAHARAHAAWADDGPACTLVVLTSTLYASVAAAAGSATSTAESGCTTIAPYLEAPASAAPPPSGLSRKFDI